MCCWMASTISHLRGGQAGGGAREEDWFVFQSYQLIPTLTALENVLLPYELNARRRREARARELLDERWA